MKLDELEWEDHHSGHQVWRRRYARQSYDIVITRRDNGTRYNVWGHIDSGHVWENVDPITAQCALLMMIHSYRGLEK